MKFYPYWLRQMKTIREQFGDNPPLGEIQEYGNDFRLAKNRTSDIEAKQAEIDYEVGFQNECWASLIG